MNLQVSGDASALSLVRANPVLGRLSPAALDGLMQSAQMVEVGAGEILVRQGEHSDCAYLILAGEFNVCVATAFGEVSLAVVSGGVLIGEIGVFAELPRTATIRARGTARVLRFERSHLLQAGENEPALLRSIITRLGGQISGFNQAIGLYTDAVSALEQDDFNLGILEALRQPVPELMNFSQSFCRMAEQIVRQRRHQAEMASAAAIQRAMLPETLPTDLFASRFEIEAHMQPAREVGGDLYDVFAADADHIVVTIGDVCGKGVPASLFMAVTQTVIRLAVHAPQDLGAEITRANQLLVAGNREMMFATLFCAVIEISSGKTTYCNCGHNPPLLLRRNETAFEALAACGPPLGIDEAIAYKAGSLTLAPGDRLFFYTDGVSEAEDPLSAQFGMDRLQAALLETRAGSARATLDEVIERVTAFSNGAPQSDDITCISLVRAD
jgi:serine phosphatase RsbU (regulator of sigma subunit)